MSTNFYWLKTPEKLSAIYAGNQEDKYNIISHIGKRSMSGAYCYDCGTTLCRWGVDMVHKSEDWYETCPICGKEVTTSSCSFTVTAGIQLKLLQELVDVDDPVAENEYGDMLTAKEMLAIIEACPIQYQLPCDFS